MTQLNLIIRLNALQRLFHVNKVIKVTFKEANLLPIIFLYNMYRAFHSSVPPILVKSLFPPEFFGSLVGFVRFCLGVTRFLNTM